MRKIKQRIFLINNGSQHSENEASLSSALCSLFWGALLATIISLCLRNIPEDVEVDFLFESKGSLIDLVTGQNQDIYVVAMNGRSSCRLDHWDIRQAHPLLLTSSDTENPVRVIALKYHGPSVVRIQGDSIIFNDTILEQIKPDLDRFKNPWIQPLQNGCTILNRDTGRTKYLIIETKEKVSLSQFISNLEYIVLSHNGNTILGSDKDSLIHLYRKFNGSFEQQDIAKIYGRPLGFVGQVSSSLPVIQLSNGDIISCDSNGKLTHLEKAVSRVIRAKIIVVNAKLKCSQLREIRTVLNYCILQHLPFFLW